MKKAIFFLFFFSQSLFAQYTVEEMTGLPPMTPEQLAQLKKQYEQNFVETLSLSETSTSTSLVKISATCPFLTIAAKDNQDPFLDLKNFLVNTSKNASCNNSSESQSISQLETLFNSESSDVACYSKNVRQISDRNMAYYYAEKGIEIPYSSDYTLCNDDQLGVEGGDKVSFENKSACISEQYNFLVEKNAKTCKTVVVPELVQTQIKNGVTQLETVLIQSLSQKDSCAPKTRETFKMVMTTYLKVKSLSVVAPWGVMAGFGADLIGTLLDKFFPAESDKASALLDDILNEENYEQNACLYYNVQQKLYCPNTSLSVPLSNTNCDTSTFSDPNMQTFFKIIYQLKKEVKPVTPPNAISITNNPFLPAAPTTFETSALESRLDDLVKYAKASQDDFFSRVNKLPKIQRATEMNKLNRFYALMDQYENIDTNLDDSGTKIAEMVQDLAKLLFSTNTKDRLNMDDIILKTTPGLDVDALKQQGIANSIENLLATAEITGKSDIAENSRSMAKYNKYKNAVGSIAARQFRDRLKKQFEEFKKHSSLIVEKESGTVTDLVSQGLFRNIIRHCTLLQEIYDPNLEGNIPEECSKFNCNNQLNWFSPKKDEKNFTNFKKNYCEKSLTFTSIEEKLLKDFTSPAGAKICGKSLKDFFKTSLF